MIFVFFLLSKVIENRNDYRNSNIYDNIDSKNITINEKRSLSRKACFCVAFLRNKCFVLPFVLFILLLTLGMLIFVLIEGNNRINNLKDDLRIKENFIAEAENQSNQTIEQWNKRLFKQQETIEQLNKSIEELKKQNNQKIKQLNDLLLQNNATIEHLNKTFIEYKTKSRI